MQLVFLVIQIIIAILLVGIILLQRSSSDGLSGLGTGGGGNGLVSSRASASFLTKTTAILAALFMINSLFLANLAARSGHDKSILDKVMSNEHHDKANHKKHHHKTEPAAPIAE